MNHIHDPDHPTGQTTEAPFWRSRYGIGLLVFGAVAAYFLLTEHRAHFFGALPFLLLLACPLMHVFMHHGHGGHGHHHGDSESKAGPEKSDQPRPGGPS
ncbi:DUF2933 domain-containing protein [Rhodoferax ferrireducens]|uniref:DUF2933 domain-containing protein n=1 Tax=Rhodoferax ferrireducens TaxID=192843 RepID=UPI000E0CE52A|nr:DUF2933 domain-containing protein [Rhodoferax ferrireducens]